MSNVEAQAAAAANSRYATLKVVPGPDLQVVSARVPAGASADEFARAARGAYELISKLTNHPCYSGRFKFVIEDPLFNEAMRVDLRTGQLM